MKPVWLLSFFFVLSQPLAAQTITQPIAGLEHLYGIGFLHQGYYKFTEKWGAFTDVQFRMDEKVQYSVQNVLRGALMYSPKPNLYVLGGYAYLPTYSETFQAYFPEHRSWQQLTHVKKNAPWMFIFRLRSEQRFVKTLTYSANKTIAFGDMRYGNRLRLYNRAIYHFNKDPEASNIFFLALHNEFFMNIASPEINKNFIDQNRFFLACGIVKDRHTRFEFGYVNTFLNPSQHRNIMVHSLNFVVLQSLDFSKTRE